MARGVVTGAETTCATWRGGKLQATARSGRGLVEDLGDDPVLGVEEFRLDHTSPAEVGDGPQRLRRREVGGEFFSHLGKDRPEAGLGPISRRPSAGWPYRAAEPLE
jgi:hypothetical protein